MYKKKDKETKGQGAIEYLIVLAVAIIAAVIVIIILNAQAEENRRNLESGGNVAVGTLNEMGDSVTCTISNPENYDSKNPPIAIDCPACEIGNAYCIQVKENIGTCVCIS